MKQPEPYMAPMGDIVDIEDDSQLKDVKISLTPLWEYVTRAQALPETLDLDLFFETIHERLRDPEWEVRQHALRVLVDFVPLIPTKQLDEKIDVILNDLVCNLGHLGPAVRKGAVDSLRSYVNHSSKTDDIIKGLVENGIEKAQENKVQTNVVLGIILSLPYLINNKLSDDCLTYVIHRLLDKIVKVIHQETVLRSLLRIRELVGYERFDLALSSHESYNSKKEFDLLCEVYDLNTFRTTRNSFRYNYESTTSSSENERLGQNYNAFQQENVKRTILKTPQHVQNSNVVTYMKTEDGLQDSLPSDLSIDEDKVILETEIKLQSGPAITMKIHEESGAESESDERNNRTFKVLPDESDAEEYDNLRRTPRRVRFGGEIVKLRTPDSDSNNQSDDNDATISIISQENSDKPIIEIKYVEKENKTTTRTTRSLIPIPFKQTQSEPNTPVKQGSNLQRSKSKSSPNLSRSKKMDPEKSRIPKRTNTEVRKSVETKIQIRISDKGVKNAQNERKKTPKRVQTAKIEVVPKGEPQQATRGRKDDDVDRRAGKEEKVDRRASGKEEDEKMERREEEKEKREEEAERRGREKQRQRHPPVRRNSREDEFSPTPIHNEIEVLHNLTRSPSPVTKTKFFAATDEETKLPDINVTQRFVTMNKKRPSSTAEAAAPKQAWKSPQSFQIYNSNEHFYGFADSPIPTKDSGDCLTCSSSGSDSVTIESKKFVQFGGLDPRTVEDLQNTDDVRARQRGLEELNRAVQDPVMLKSLEEKLPTLLYVLFTAEQQSILQPIAEQTLGIVFATMNEQVLIQRLQQISLSLSKMGSPLGVRLAILLMRRIPPGLLVDQLLADSILGAKSSKVREGALQILMTVSRIFPSTEMNVPKSARSVVLTLRDKKKKVRQAALETLAALSQLSSPAMVLEIAQEVAEDWGEREQVLRVLRTRLSRKQLPAVNMNGNIRYSSPSAGSETEWLSRGSGSPQTIPRTPQKPPQDQNNNLQEAEERRKRFIESKTETFSTDTFIINREETFEAEEKFVVLESPGRFVRRTVEASFSEDEATFVGGGSKEAQVGKELEDEEKLEYVEPKVNILKISHENSMSSNAEGEEAFVVQQQRPETVPSETHDPPEAPPPQRASTSTSSNKKVNYWKSNARKLHIMEKEVEELEESEEEPAARAPSTQIWAIDPAGFGASEKPAQSNALRQVYLVKPPQESRTASTNTPPHDYREGATNTTPFYIRPNSRGRSYSPPNRQDRQSDYDSYEEQQETRRFVRTSYRREVQRIRREERVRKSFSSEHLNLERLRKESGGVVSSGSSSSGSSIRHISNWHNRGSGIPVPINTDTKFRIRSKNSYRQLNRPLSIPFYPQVKSPSPQSTPEKFTAPEEPLIIGRQPFSSGSESSGYFTPPPEGTREHTPDVTPLRTPQPSPEPQQERFIKLESASPRSEQEDVAEEVAEEEVAKESNLKEQKQLSTSLDETDFTQITFSEKRNLSKSEVDIKISTQISRKNVNSAPSLNDVSDYQAFEVDSDVAKTSMPDSLDNTEAPEELFAKTSPVKKSFIPTKIKSSGQKRPVKNPAPTIYPETLRPFSKPRDGFHEVVEQLESTEWEVIMKGLQGMVRLIRHHREAVENQMHAVCVLLGKHIRNLRSQVARAACLVASELFGMSKRPLELEVDEIAGPLLHRTADTNKFLRSDANAALDEMCANLSVPKVVSVITFRGSSHQNAVVRSSAARLLCNIVHKLGAERVFQLPRDTRDKILVTGANMLTEGSLETRKHAKMLLGDLAHHTQFQRALQEAVPASVLRHIDKTLRSLMK